MNCCYSGQCCRSMGLSAHAIVHGGMDYPHDSGDFHRCLKVSWNPPDHMRWRSRHWAVLVDHWVELRDLLESERPWGKATYDRMQELFRGVERL